MGSQGPATPQWLPLQMDFRRALVPDLSVETSGDVFLSRNITVWSPLRISGRIAHRTSSFFTYHSATGGRAS